MKERGDDERDGRAQKHHVSDQKQEQIRKSEFRITDIRMNSMLQYESSGGI